MSETTHLRRGPRSPAGTRKAHQRRLWARRATQVAALAVFLAVFVATRQRLEGAPPDDPFILLDPLLGVAAMLATWQILPRLLWGLALLGLALVAGRLWCGWLCPLGTILDAAGGPKARPTGQPLRRFKYMLLTAVLAAALLGNLTLVALDPLTILTRSLATAVWPALNWLFTGAESLLYRVPLLRAPVTGLDSLVRGGLLPYAQPPAPAALLFGGLFLGILALNAIAPRLWCRALCPLGAGLGLLSRLAPVRRRVSEDCINCGRCARICPTQTIDPERGFASDPAECTLCMHCFVACPVDAQRLSGPWSLPVHQPYDPTRRQVLLAGGLGLATAALGRVTVAAAHPEAYRLLPPGARDPEFSRRCLRCGRCMKACSCRLSPALLNVSLKANDLAEAEEIGRVAPSLGAALDALEADHAFLTKGEVMPLDLIEAYVRVKRAEIEQVERVPHPVELQLWGTG